MNTYRVWFTDGNAVLVNALSQDEAMAVASAEASFLTGNKRFKKVSKVENLTTRINSQKNIVNDLPSMFIPEVKEN
jgi:hypothetical protein